MSQENAIDESLYTERLYDLGFKAMKGLTVSSVLGSAVGGVEIAKGSIFSCVKNIITRRI